MAVIRIIKNKKYSFEKYWQTVDQVLHFQAQKVDSGYEINA